MELLFLVKLVDSSTNKLYGFSTVVSAFCLSSHLVYLDKEHYNEKAEVRTRSYYQQQFNNTYSFKRWKDSNNTNHSISYRTSRVRALLAYYLEHVTYNMSWMRQHHNPTTSSNIIQRRTVMSSCRYCGNPIVFDDNILSKNGKHKPLNEWNHEVHDCDFSPFNKARATAKEKKAINKLEEYQVIENLRSEVATINNRLWNYEVQLTVRDKEF